jgi:hypothetical protein
MAFVKVVAGNEIYNFRIQSFVHFYSKFWSYLCSNKDSAKQTSVGRALRHDAPAPPRHLRLRPPPTEAARHPRPAPFPGRPAPRGASEPVRHAPPRRRVVRAPCTRRTAGTSGVWSVRARTEERRSTAASRRRRHGHASRVYLSTAARLACPCRAALAVCRHGCDRRLGELLPAPSTKLRTHAHLFLVTCNTSSHHILRRPRRRLAAARPQRLVPPNTADRAYRHRSAPAFGHDWVVGELLVTFPPPPRPSPGSASPESRPDRRRSAPRTQSKGSYSFQGPGCELGTNKLDSEKF